MRALFRQLWPRLPQLSQHRFAIASSLLGDPNLLAWSNLGFWHDTLNYQVACAQLAQQVGMAAQLQTTDHVLDLGCGQGASLVYWASRFGVQHISGFEIQAACIARVQSAQLPQLQAIYPAAFDQLPLPDASLYQAFDAVLCVDAAYHACLTDFLAVARATLAPHGRIAFTTLGKSSRWSQASAWDQYLTRQLLNRAYVPAHILLARNEISAQLAQAGFTDIQVQILDQQVFAGFAHYIEQLEPPAAMTLAQRTDWLKIKMTAQLCAFLARHGLVHYLLVSARLASV